MFNLKKMDFMMKKLQMHLIAFISNRIKHPGHNINI